MPLGLNFLENMLDLAIRTDDERRAGNPHDLPPVHVLFLQDAVSDRHLFVDVGQQGEGQALLFCELFLGRGLVGRHPKQHGAGLLNLFI